MHHIAEQNTVVVEALPEMEVSALDSNDVAVDCYCDCVNGDFDNDHVNDFDRDVCWFVRAIDFVQAANEYCDLWIDGFDYYHIVSFLAVDCSLDHDCGYVSYHDSGYVNVYHVELKMIGDEGHDLALILFSMWLILFVLELMFTGVKRKVHLIDYNDI